MWTVRTIVPFCLAAVTSGQALAGSDVVDTRITFVLSDDNVLAGSKDRSPTADIGQRSNNKTFFDNYDTKDSGQETKTNLTFYKAFDGPWPRIETEAALSARFDLFTDEETGRPDNRFRDDGTFLQASYLLGDLGDENEVSPPGSAPRLYLLAFPFNADRIRLGYSYDITWGGNAIFPKNNTGAPGLKMGWESDRAYAFVGFKTHRQLNEETKRLDAVYGALAGFGFDILPELRWEVNGGAFEKGVFAPQNSSQPGPLAGKGVYAEGVSTQLTYHVGLPIESSVDLRLYRNDPRFPWQAFKEETYSSELSYMAATEFTYLMQNVRNPDVVGESNLQAAMAGDVNLRAKMGFWKFSADFVYRDVPYILFNVPSLIPFQGFPDTAEAKPEWFAAIGASYYFEQWRFNPGVTVGYKRPATYVGDTAALKAQTKGVATVVVRGQGDLEILPQGKKAKDIISVRAFGRWFMSDGMGLILEATYTYDKNATRLKSLPEDGTTVRKFDRKNVINRLSLALMLQARF